MSSSRPPGISITNNNLGPGANLVTWICLVLMCLVVILKVLSKLIRNHKTISIHNLQSDDFLIITAMIVAIAQSISVSVQVPLGLGEHESILTVTQIESYEKAGYASQLLYVAALCIAQLSNLYFIITLTRVATYRSAVRGSIGFTITWYIASTLAIAFQCRIPRSWAIISGQCFDQRAFWYAYGALDILINLILIGIPVCVLWTVQTSWAKKSVVVFAFAVRAIYIPLVILRLIYISSTFRSPDRTHGDFRVAVVTQVGMNLCIILACVPFLKPLLDNIQPGWSTSNVRTGLGYNSMVDNSIGREYPMGSVVKRREQFGSS